MNDGDWVENCTALVEHHDGQWELVTWTKDKRELSLDTPTNSSERDGSEGHSREDNPGVHDSVVL